jgi:succinate dehydrogenase / fumarate reductase, membrane anchor subunit
VSRQAAGLRAWLLQRLSGLLLAGYLCYLTLHFLFDPPPDHAAWAAWVGQPINGVGLLLGVVALLLHSWVGFRDVLIDYVPLFALRLTLLSLLACALLACGLWAQAIILMPLLR